MEITDEMLEKYKKNVLEVIAKQEEIIPHHIMELDRQLSECREKGLNDEDVLNNFAGMYLMPSKYWRDLRRGVHDAFQATKGEIDLGLKAIKHFCYDIINDIEKSGYIVRYFNQQCYYPLAFPTDNYLSYDFNSRNKVKEGFKYPHKGLKIDLISHEKLSMSPTPKETISLVEKMDNLYEKIMSAKTMCEKFEYMMESNNVQFVKQNFEIEICSDLNNKQLWKFYIKYLKGVDVDEMLQVYSKYCRYFLDDFEMKEEYKKEVETHGGVTVTWKNPFDFETPLSSYVLAKKGNVPCEEEEVGTTKNDNNHDDDFEVPALNYDSNGYFRYHYSYTEFRNVVKQQFPFKSPLMTYIITSDNIIVQQKLQQTCKYFFSKRQILYCYSFLLQYYTQRPRIIEEFIEFTSDCHHRNYSQKIFHITTVFQLRGPHPKFLEIFNNNIYKCDAKYVAIDHQELTENELLFLIAHGNVEDLRLIKCNIKKEDSEVMLLEEILTHVPKLKILCIENQAVKTSNTLSKLKFMNKFYEIRIKFLANEIDPEDFCEFVTENITSLSIVRVSFTQNTNHQPLQIAIQRIEYDWMPRNDRPKISCRSWESETARFAMHPY